MAVDAAGILNAVVSKAQTLGVFDSVNGHEPMKVPGRGVTAAFWYEAIGPHVRGSGLNTTSANLVMFGRTYADAFLPNLDIVEPALLDATVKLIGALSLNFTLDSALNVQSISLLGETGQSTFARAGYLNQDGRMKRIYNLTISMIIRDA